MNSNVTFKMVKQLTNILFCRVLLILIHYCITIRYCSTVYMCTIQCRILFLTGWSGLIHFKRKHLDLEHFMVYYNCTDNQGLDCYYLVNVCLLNRNIRNSFKSLAPSIFQTFFVLLQHELSGCWKQTKFRYQLKREEQFPSCFVNNISLPRYFLSFIENLLIHFCF